MKKIIFPCNIQPLFLYGLFLIALGFTGKNFAKAHYWQNSNSVFDGQATGIIRDILYLEDRILLGAENGLFVFKGNITEKLDLPVGSFGYISDLEPSHDGGVWVSVYSDGLYKITNSGKWSKFDLDPRLENSWKVLDFGNRLAILTIGSLLIVNKETYNVEKSIQGFTEKKFSEIPYVVKIDNTLAVIEKSRLIVASNLGGDIEINELEISNVWPNLSAVELLKKYHEKYYAVGPEGIYESQEFLGSHKFYESEEAISNPISIADKSGRKFLISREILEIKEDALNSVLWDDWLWSPEDNGFLTGFVETKYQDFLITSSRKGFIYTPTYFDAIRLSSVQEHFDNQLLDKSALTDRFNSKIYRLQVHRACGTSQEEESGLKGLLCKEGVELIVPYVDRNWLVLQERNGKQKLSVRNEDSVEVDSFALPDNVVDVTVDSSGQIYLLTTKNRIYVQLSKLLWKDLEVVIPNSSRFTCFFAREQGIIYVCSSSTGVWQVDSSSLKLTKAPVGGIDSIRYIRSGITDSNGDLWFATNSGLFYYNSHLDYWQGLGNLDGIKDIDFEYYGLAAIEDTLLIDGDNFDYEIQGDAFRLREGERRSRQSNLNIQVREGISGKYLRPDEAKEFYTVKKGREILNVVGFVNDFINRRDLGIEYTVKSVSGKWRAINSPNFDITFPKLPPGNHTIHLRVLDPRSQAEQPVTSVKIRVLPPWWQSWQAQLSFFVLMVIVTWLIYFIYQRRVREQAIFYTGLVDEKNYALTEAQDSLKEMLIRKQKQFTNLSHEIRTPLSLIIGPIAQLKKSIQSPENIEKVELVERNAKNIEAIIAEMMEIESFGNDAKRSVQEYAVNAVCSRILFDMVALAELARKKLMWKCDTKMKISLYKGTLEKIIGNLVSNAIKYTPTKGKIEVNIYEEELQLCIFVKDNGYGMSEEQIGKMYQRHIRFTEGGQGSGVGLALVKEVVMANDGWINVESAVDEGTTFRVFLPMLREIDQSANSPETKEITVQEPTEIDYDVLKTEHGTKSVILIVDDNEEMRLYLQSVLKDHYKCLLAEHGQQALEITAHIVPDLVITDYKMPVMSGTDLTLAMRESTLTSDIPIIMLSGLTDSDSVAEGLEASIDTYVNKPVNPEILLLRIKNLLNRNEKRREKAVAETLVQDNDHVPDYVTERDQKFYLSVLNQLELHYRNDSFTKLELANNLAISERQLHRKISAIFGTSYSDLLRDFRLSKAKEMLVEGKQITHVVYDAGFSAPSYFSRCFKENTGLTPTEYQKAHHKPKLRKVKHSPKKPKPE